LRRRCLPETGFRNHCQQEGRDGRPTCTDFRAYCLQYLIGQMPVQRFTPLPLAQGAGQRQHDFYEKGRPGKAVRHRWPDRFLGMTASGWITAPPRTEADLVTNSVMRLLFEAQSSLAGLTGLDLPRSTHTARRAWEGAVCAPPGTTRAGHGRFTRSTATSLHVASASRNLSALVNRA
jgi:hypothetical protein